MLKRIQKISNIGKFSNCICPGCEFKENTIIFGCNTQGKSTFTAILRSLQTGNDDILIGRKTFGSTASKNVEMDFVIDENDEKFIFQNKKWNRVNPNILIFDSRFIAENIFNGETITFDQQKNLNTIIIGSRGQELNREILKLQVQSEIFANKKTEKTRFFSKYFPDLDFNKFRKLQKIENIEDKIKIKDEEIRFEVEREENKKAIKAHIQTISALDFSIREVLAKTLDANQIDIERHIIDHFSTQEGARNFLRDGLNFLKEKPVDMSARTCIFCGQELNIVAEKLISIYKAFFTGGYERLQFEINKVVDYFKSYNLEATLEKIAGDLKSRGLSIGLDSEKIIELAALKNNFEKELYKKRDLNYIINFESFDSLKESVELYKNKLIDLEQKKLGMVSQKGIQILLKEKKDLEISMKRYETVWIDFCNAYDLIEKDAEKIRTDRDKIRKQLAIHSAMLFNVHKQTINFFCKEMGADFEIVDFKPLGKIVGTDERIFAIQFFGSHRVNIDNDENSTANFRNTLSESDKRLLAFSFFLSLLAHDHELNHKVIVFDDPMSSFDHERRRKTIHLITDIEHKSIKSGNGTVVLRPLQKIILTHEDRFAKELVRLMPDAQTLKIEEYIEVGNKRSKIVHSDFMQDFPDDDISQRIENLEEILKSRTFSINFQEDCRKVLEHIFKRKYYLDIKEAINMRKGVRTFVEKLRELKINNFENDDKNTKFLRLCSDLNIELHDNVTESSNGDKESILKDFFECLRII